MPEIPVIDISAIFGDDPSEKQRLATAVDAACREVGFLVVTGHGVDAELLASLRRCALEFFDLPETEKRRSAANSSDHSGYVSSEALSYSAGEASPPDLKESFTVHPPGRRGGDDPNPWPDVPGFRTTLTTYFQTMESLAAEVMSVFAIALGLPERWFDDYIDESLSAVRMLHYPPLTEHPQPGQLRAGAHTDFGSLTLLLTDSAPGGLQVRSRAGQWIDVPHRPDAFVVNIGDLMAQWTNDRWVSTHHRVVVPPVGPGTRRLSVAFFHQPNDDALIETLPTCRQEGEPSRYEPIRSGEHLRLKVKRQREMKV